MPPSPKGSSEDHTIDAFLAAVDDSLTRHRLVVRGDRILVAVSGGPDSVALLVALHRLAHAHGIALSVAHLHHGLRGPSADADACRVKDLATRLGLPLAERRVAAAAEARHRRVSLETAGRHLRYAFFQEAATVHRCGKIALGHQRNDNAELVLMNLIRGAGPLGLAAMPPIRGGRFIRPLLAIGREQILSFLKAAGVDYGEDETNRHLDHRRNWIRHVLLPLVAEQANPAIVDALHRTAAISGDEEAWLAQVAADLYQSVLVQETDDQVTLDSGALVRLALAARRRVLRHAMGRLCGDLHRITMAHVEAALALVAEKGRSRCLHLPRRLRLSAAGGQLDIRRLAVPLRQAQAPAAWRHDLTCPGRIAIPELDLQAEAAVHFGPTSGGIVDAGHWSAFFDINAVSFPLIIRSAAPGDRFRPLGAGGRQKVAKFFIDHKVPRPLRPAFPIVESAGRIIWLAGQRLAEGVAAGSDGDRVLSLVFRPINFKKDLFQ
ncbi:MAG: tRNA lysidine(34) synthetase TilS [Desulfobacteraceae bacterium]|jgi:tRNA(Ile)-lysidine synthase|nr:tRNA lysidine(34) synthetase TilS [Desulfobacteraceae bacterium]